MRQRDLHPGAAVWGDVDEETGMMPIFASHGELFSVDMRSGRCFEPGEDACYFIGPEGGTHVKIGKSTNVPQRLRALQLASPVRLKVLAVTKGGRAQEAAYHRMFARDRAWGEWFWRSSGIDAEMKRLQKAISLKALEAETDIEFEILGIDDVRRVAPKATENHHDR